MKKLILSGVFIVIFIMYAVYQSFGGAGTVAYVSNNSNTITTNTIPSTQTTTPTPTPQPVVVPTKTTPAPTPTPTPVVVTPPPVVKKGLYTDGTYTGNVADAYYGNIQVQVAVSGGQISDVVFLQYPSDRSTSRRINGQAMPILKSEAISAQSSNVNIVSGATDSSQAFRQSLASALSQAKA